MPEFILRRFVETQFEAWDRFVAGSPQGTVFNTSQWASVVRNVFGVQNTIYGVLKNDNLVGGISVFHKRKFGLNIITRIPLAPYSGILFFPPSDQKYQKIITEQEEISGLILRELEQHFQFVHFSLNPNVQDVRVFQWHRWHLNPQFTYVNRIDNIEAVWDNLSSSLRRKIHNAQGNKFNIAEKDNPSILLTLQEESYKRSGLKPVLPRNNFEFYCGALLKEKMLKIYSISDNAGNVHSERAVVLWKDFVYDWIAGTDPKLLEQNATHLLLWEIMKRLSADGYALFDFLGANTPHIVDFKQSFGGELKNYYEVSFYSSPIVKLLNTLNSRVELAKRNVKS
jgi:hypothetical protein